jgi:hypothetical protein
MADEDTLRAERAVAEEEANQWAYVLLAVLPIVGGWWKYTRLLRRRSRGALSPVEF